MTSLDAVTVGRAAATSSNPRRERARRLYIKALWLGGTVLALACLVMLNWMLFPNEKTVTEPGDYTVEQSTVVAGNPVTVIGTRYCNYGVDRTVERSISNGTGALSLPTIYFFAPPQTVCFDPVVFNVLIPHETPPGEWKIIFTSSYRANPLRTITTVRETNFFTVLPAPNN